MAIDHPSGFTVCIVFCSIVLLFFIHFFKIHFVMVFFVVYLITCALGICSFVALFETLFTKMIDKVFEVFDGGCLQKVVIFS